MMLFAYYKHNGRASVSLLCHTLCLSATTARAVTALPDENIESIASIALSTATFDLLPITGLIPSASIIPKPAPIDFTPSQTRGIGLIPSQTPLLDATLPVSIIPQSVPSGLLSSAPIPIDPEPASFVLIPSVPVITTTIPSELIPSASLTLEPIPSTSNINLIPSLTAGLEPPTPTPPLLSSLESHGVGTSMASTDEGLRPIPAPTTAPGDPNGHHEISEPNFTATVPCHGCSPVVEISATGFFDWPSTPIADHASTSLTLATPLPSKATITAGSSEVIISKEPTGGGFVIGGSTTDSSGQTLVDKTTVTAGQTVVIDSTPVAIQTSGGSTIVMIGTATIPITLFPDTASSGISHITQAPIFTPVVLGSQTLTANSLSQYLVSGQTLSPGGPAITVDGTTISLAPSGTVLVVNGQTTTIRQPYYDAVYTSTLLPLLTLFDNNQVFTANRAGKYILAPGTTLAPGGPAVTVSGTIVSLDPTGTAVVVQGSTKSLAPQTTVVTITRGGGAGHWSGMPYSVSSGLPRGTARLPPVSAGISLVVVGGWLEGVLLLWVMGTGWLTVWL